MSSSCRPKIVQKRRPRLILSDSESDSESHSETLIKSNLSVEYPTEEQLSNAEKITFELAENVNHCEGAKVRVEKTRVVKIDELTNRPNECDGENFLKTIESDPRIIKTTLSKNINGKIQMKRLNGEGSKSFKRLVITGVSSTRKGKSEDNELQRSEKNIYSLPIKKNNTVSGVCSSGDKMITRNGEDSFQADRHKEGNHFCRETITSTDQSPHSTDSTKSKVILRFKTGSNLQGNSDGAQKQTDSQKRKFEKLGKTYNGEENIYVLNNSRPSKSTHQDSTRCSTSEKTCYYQNSKKLRKHSVPVDMIGMKKSGHVSGLRDLCPSSLTREKKSHLELSSLGKIDKNEVATLSNSSDEKSEHHDLYIPNSLSSKREKISANNNSQKEERKKRNSHVELEFPTLPKQKKSSLDKAKSTERQQLREKLKNLLLTAGWTIDLRPRRGKNYKDSVYVSPTGVAYWSVVNAYNALQKELNQDGADNSKQYALSRTLEKELGILKRKRVKKITGEADKKYLGKKNKDTGVNSKKLAKKRQERDKMNVCLNRQKKGGKHPKGWFKRTVTETTYSYTKLHEFSDSDDEKGSRMKRIISEKSSRALKSGIDPDRKWKPKGCSLVVRKSSEGYTENGDYIPYMGKRTVLSWLIDSKVVSKNEKVRYMNKNHSRTLLEGKITRDGISCGCCGKIVTLSKFEMHSGSKRCHPLQNIFVESQLSLLQCLRDAWNRQSYPERFGFHYVDTKEDDPNDDTCSICADGGDLICCDGCPSTFHQSCLDIRVLPKGDWHCPNCSCKFCGLVNNGDADSPLVSCSQCEKKYHEKCIQEVDDVSSSSSSLHEQHDHFCGQSCKKLFLQLQNLLGTKNDLPDGFSWTLVHRFDEDSRTAHNLAKWAECNSKLAVAFLVMDECFMPFIDPRTGTNLIRNVLYNFGSNFSRLNYSSFYTFILEKDDEIISAASIRLHGTQLAEMPFIGTRHIYRRQGMCRLLLNSIEAVLNSLDVRKLFIPAISDLMHTWTTVFGFLPLEATDKEKVKSTNMMMFPGTGLLQKSLSQHELVGEGPHSDAVRDTDQRQGNHNMSEITTKSSELPNKLHIESKVDGFHKIKGDPKVIKTEKYLHSLGNISLCYASDGSSSSIDALSNSDIQDSVGVTEKNSVRPKKSIPSTFVASVSFISDMTNNMTNIRSKSSSVNSLLSGIQASDVGTTCNS